MLSRMEISMPWRHDGEGEALHFVIRDAAGGRRIKLKRSENAALYDFLAERIRGSTPE